MGGVPDGCLSRNAQDVGITALRQSPGHPSALRSDPVVEATGQDCTVVLPCFMVCEYRYDYSWQV